MIDFFVFVLKELRRIAGFLMSGAGVFIALGAFLNHMWLVAGVGAMVFCLGIWMQRYDD